MSSDSIVEQLTKYGEIDEQEAWNGFKQAYLLKTPEFRIIDLKACDFFSTSSIIQRKRRPVF